MIQLDSINTFFEHSVEAFLVHVDVFYLSVRRLCFHACALFDASERTEQTVFYTLKALSKKSVLTEQEKDSFVQATARINQLFEDDIIRRHTIRLNNSLTGWEQYQNKRGEEKALIRLHELSEILSFKWDYGRDFDDQTPYHFWEAHKRAIKIENVYMSIKAEKMSIPLTLKALNYIRLVDECHLPGIMCIRREENLNDAIKNLTKRQDKLPSVVEMEAFVEFMTKSAILPYSEPSIRNMVWSRYFFTVLYQKPHVQTSESYAKMILLLLYFHEKKDTLATTSPQVLLDKITKILSELTDADYRNVLYFFLDEMERISRDEPVGYHLNRLTTG